jgi:hypothetical protein
VPIKWSPVSVSRNADEVEELMSSIRPTLWLIREKAEELRRVPHLPGYIDQPAATMASKVDNFNTYMKGYVERIHHLIPKDALEEERKVMEYGSQQSMI